MVFDNFLSWLVIITQMRTPKMFPTSLPHVVSFLKYLIARFLQGYRFTSRYLSYFGSISFRSTFKILKCMLHATA